MRALERTGLGLLLVVAAACGTIKENVTPKDQAIDALNRRNYPDAIVLLSQLHEKSPDDSEITILLASAYGGVAGFDVVQTIGAFQGSLFTKIKNPLTGQSFLVDGVGSAPGTSTGSTDNNDVSPVTDDSGNSDGSGIAPGSGPTIAVGPEASVPAAGGAPAPGTTGGTPATSPTGDGTTTSPTPDPSAPASPAAPAAPAALPDQATSVKAIEGNFVLFLNQLTSNFKTLSAIPFTKLEDRRNLVQALLLLGQVKDDSDPTRHSFYLRADTYAAVLNALQFLNYTRDAMTSVINKPDVGFLEAICAIEAHTFFENLDTSTGYLLSSLKDLTITYQAFGKTMPGKLGLLSDAAVHVKQVYQQDQARLSDADLALTATKAKFCGTSGN